MATHLTGSLFALKADCKIAQGGFRADWAEHRIGRECLLVETEQSEKQCDHGIRSPSGSRRQALPDQLSRTWHATADFLK